MGNGSGLKTIGLDFETVGLDTQGSTLSLQDLEDAVAKASAAFGQPNQIFMPLQSFFMMNGTTYYPNPQYVGTEWAHINRPTKREHAFAKLQTFLVKMGLQKHLQDEDERRADYRVAEKRLKRAKWARYQQKKA